MFYHFLLLKLICFKQLNSFKRVRFFWYFKFIFSCVRTGVKIWLQNLWQTYRKFPVKIEIFVNFLILFWYIVNVVLLTCSCRRLYSTCCCCLLLQQVIDLHQFKPTFVLYIVTCKYICWFKLVYLQVAIYSTNVGLNWCESITCLTKRQQQQVE